jgi:PAT family beta-lactamase induction signal transducer AmpG
MVDGVRLPILWRLGQRVSWMLFTGVLVIAAVANLAFVDPTTSLIQTAYAAILVGAAGATFDVVIDAYRIEILRPDQMGVGSGMTQYGWRIGSTLAATLALVLASRIGWNWSYMACAVLAFPAMITALVLGEPERRQVMQQKAGISETFKAIWGPFVEFFSRQGAFLVLLFILFHKIGDTLSQLTVRLLFNDLGFSNDEIAIYDVGVGFWMYLIGIFVGGVLYAKLGMKRSVMISLVLMGITNLNFAILAHIGHSNWALAATMAFETFASGIGGVTVVAYFSVLTDLRFTAAQYALISAASSIFGRILTGTSAGALVESLGYVNFYLLTTLAAVPGIFLFWLLARGKLIDTSMGSAGKQT